MRKYGKWVVTLGLVAAAPNVGLAGPFDLFRSQPKAEASGASNQEVAQAVKAQLEQANLSGAEIDIEVVSGKLTLKGTAPDAETVAAINRMANSVPGVTTVDNHMTVRPATAMHTANQQAPAGQTGAVQQASQAQPAGMKAPGVTPVAYMQDEAVVPPAAPPAVGAPGMMPGGPAGMPPAGMPPAAVPPAPPAWAQGAAAASGPVFDQPAQPQYAWPSYAQYPNSGALTYPRQHSASAWPYIGPYYPYPQVPLGWRDVTLQWDDGHWYLDFNDRTDRWWWFFNPKKW